MTTSDRNECIQVTLTMEDWATVIAAVGLSHATLTEKERINSTIFTSARYTERQLT